MSVFRFKQFAVEHDTSTMKVGLDAVLLGAKCILKPEKTMSILEVGCGCGVISLMAAQRFKQSSIHAIDIHNPSVDEAKINFENSPFKAQLSAECISLQQFTFFKITSHVNYDYIISNPPFFTNALKSPNNTINTAKHNVTLTYDTLIECSNKLLSASGKINLIIPFDEYTNLINAIKKSEMFVSHITNIHIKDKIKRLIVEISKKSDNTQIPQYSDFHVYAGSNYSEEYLHLMQPFLSQSV